MACAVRRVQREILAWWGAKSNEREEKENLKIQTNGETTENEANNDDSLDEMDTDEIKGGKNARVFRRSVLGRNFFGWRCLDLFHIGRSDLVELTASDIREDIRAFQARIQADRDKLAALPDGQMSYPIRKRIDKQRRALEDDVRHIEQLLIYAREGLLNEHQ